MMNERIPTFEPPVPGAFPVPSMRYPGRRGSAEGEGLNMEALIRRTLEEGGDVGDAVEKLAEKLAKGRRVTGRPMPLKRHETA